MVKRSKGKMSKRSRLLRNRTGKAVGISQIVQTFNVGESVKIDICSRYGGSPHPRYRGRHGTIVGKRGDAYVVQIRDYTVLKRLIIPPVHLQR
ncbi:50S ribosomal protein L21e [Candidatus Micrarchaeota archaeon]|nr:50S ribosomal protein L21e [Candidatus Micrarchaeota archaeon]